MTISINPQVDEEESSRTGLTLSSSRALDFNYFSSASPVCILTASVLSNSATLWTVACWLLCPWYSPGKNTRVGCLPCPPPGDRPYPGVEPSSLKDLYHLGNLLLLLIVSQLMLKVNYNYKWIEIRTGINIHQNVNIDIF